MDKQDCITFRSAIDLWFMGVFLMTAAAMFYFAFTDIIKLGWISAIPAIIFALLINGFLAWLLSTTYYQVYPTELRARSGPLRYVVKIEDIVSIRPSRSLISSPAMSLDRLAIKHKAGELLVSPRDRQGFVQALLEVNSGIDADLQK